MRVRDGNLPNTHVREDGREELAEGEGNDQFEVILPRYVDVLAYAPHVKQRPAVNGDGEQLDHRHRHGVREFVEEHFADDIVAGTDRVPRDAQEKHR